MCWAYPRPVILFIQSNQTTQFTVRIDGIICHHQSTDVLPSGIDRPDDQLKIVETNVPKLPVARSTNEKSNDSTSDVSIDVSIRWLFSALAVVHSETTEPTIPLSNSVLVTIPTPSQLRLVHPLEETFRPRYKSDYFPQKGPVRRPRYVADKEGNHYATIQVIDRHISSHPLTITSVRLGPGRSSTSSQRKIPSYCVDHREPFRPRTFLQSVQISNLQYGH